MKRNLLKLSVTAIFVCSLYGCGHVSNSVLTDEMLLDKAEMATGIPRAELTLTKRDGSIDAVEFSVETKDGDLYRCYFTSLVALNSDAICRQIGTSKKAKKNKSGSRKKTRQSVPDCNALLKAAGKC